MDFLEFSILDILFPGASVNYMMAPDADAWDCCCGSMLMLAIDRGCEQTIPLLLEHPEIDLSLRWEKTSALDIAATRGNKEALDMLLSVCKHVYSNLVDQAIHALKKTMHCTKQIYLCPIVQVVGNYFKKCKILRWN